MENRVELKEMPVKSRMAYIWDYYKLWILGAIAVLALLGTVLYQTTQIHVDDAIAVTLVNTDIITVDESSLFDDFIEQYYDPKMEQASVSANLKLSVGDNGTASGNAYQVLSAQLLSCEIDVFISDEPVFNQMAAGGSFANLEEVLSKEHAEALEPYYIYTTDSETGETYPAGILLDDCKRFMAENFYTVPAVLAVGVSSQRTDAVDTFIDYLYE